MTSRQADSEYSRVAGPAVRQVRYAVQSGRLIKTPCADCGGPSLQAHHHNGYDPEHALDIVWLCRPCHLRRHGRAPRPSWHGRVREYIRETRPDWREEKWHQFSNRSGPNRLLKTVERIWGLLRTDEERAAMVALFTRLAAESTPAASGAPRAVLGPHSANEDAKAS